MATLYRVFKDPERDYPVPAELRERCSFCGQPWPAAYWDTLDGPVSACGGCATDVLAAFAADAVLGENAHVSPVRHALESALVRLERSFWRAAFLALGRAGDRERRATGGRN